MTFLVPSERSPSPSPSPSSTHTSPSHVRVSYPAAYKVFQIPELADTIALYLRPIYISQLRLVSRTLYSAYRPYLRLHLHRDSTASWTSFPPPLTLRQFQKPYGNNNNNSSNDSVNGNCSNRDDTCEGAESSKESGASADGSIRTITVTATAEETGGQEDMTATPAIGYGDLVRTITTDTMDNFVTIKPLLLEGQCPNLHTLIITRWNKDVCPFQGLLHNLPQLQSLSVSFYVTVDMNGFLSRLTGKPTLSSSSSSSSSSSTIMEAETAAIAPSTPALTSATTITGAQETSGGSGSLSLRTLDIKHRVPDTNYVRWRVFTSTLDALPSLQHLSLTGIGFRGADENEDDAMATTMIMDISMMPTIIPMVHHNHVPGHGHIVELGSQQQRKDPHLKSRTYPQIQSLSLTYCECPMSTMLDLNRALPQLESLELNKCRNNCLQVFEPEPPHQNNSANNNNVNNNNNNNHAYHQPYQYPHSQNHHGRTVPTPPPPAFPNLTQLKIMDRYQGHQVPIYEIVKTRPKLDSLEIQDITLNLESLMVMAGYCAEQGRFLRRFLLAPFWSLSNTRGFERLYEAPFLAKARHLFIQEELTEKILFASTLTTLYIDVGFGGEVIFESECAPVSVWNAVLRRLPNLNVLRIDRYVTDYALFDGLGRSPTPTPLLPETEATDTVTSTALPSATSNALNMTTSTASDLQGTTREDWSQERPFLQVLQLTFRDSFTVKTIDLDHQLVQRFRFLEKLYFECYRKPDDLDAYKHRWRPGLTVEHRRCLFK